MKAPEGLRPLVLVVDDSYDILDMYRYYLEHAAGMDVVVSESAEGALDCVSNGRPRPAAIVMDLMMPGIGGIEGIRRLKADPSMRPIPIIVLTANHSASTKAAAVDACCDRFLLKPVFPEKLVDEIRGVLDSPRREPVPRGRLR